MFINKILVALDRSELSKQIFEQALALAKVTQASLMLLHVLSTEEEGSPYVPIVYSGYSGLNYYSAVQSQTLEVYQEQWNAFKHQSLEMLKSYYAQADIAGVTTEFSQNSGNPGRCICDVSRSWGADLIIMGRRGNTGLKELFLGSVSNYVLHHAPCSVHIVHLPIVAKKTEDAQQTESVSI
ncbi:universal stress protein [Scytonema hofmannii FACHB-248]|uniref:Universal stress protein n=1 Tax=Scytonema hofmannii FACHB-248 TaxID=1842502 RepID=A0ABR8GXX8_9CYAN|nr:MULTISPECIES: universal stress protein [Nostocales]MBD2607925.1 universal stress protein [Scytonema hofmannii FACHB-248]